MRVGLREGGGGGAPTSKNGALRKGVPKREAGRQGQARAVLAVCSTHLTWEGHLQGGGVETAEEGGACMRAKSLRLCLTLCDPMDCDPPGSSVHGILQATTLEWVAMSSSRGSSQPRNPSSPMSPALAGGFFTTSATLEAQRGEWGRGFHGGPGPAAAWIPLNMTLEHGFLMRMASRNITDPTQLSWWATVHGVHKSRT